jgi:hypothetical protein
MSNPGAAPLSATVNVHGVAFELSARPDAGETPISQDEFQKYVNRLTRMVLGLSQTEAETLRDELLILDGLGQGVRLDALADEHPLSTSAAAGGGKNSAQIRIRALDPVLNPKSTQT